MKTNDSCWELYVHYPYCVRKCNYCDFLSFPIGEAPCVKEYESLIEQDFQKELSDEQFSSYWKTYPLRSVFLGGGTPSLMPVEDLERFFEVLHKWIRFVENPEITIEANPGTFNKEKALSWRRMGINRVSVGVQSFDDTLLQRLGRIHSAEEAFKQILLLSECGFENISLDLMFGLPGQTLYDWQKTLETACSLPIKHISCYSLIVEEGTPFFNDYEKGALKLPDDNLEREMAHRATTFLQSKGFFQYEISNFSKPGFESIHNIGYWEHVPYLGLGLGAASLSVDDEGKLWRYSKTNDFNEYESGQARVNLQALSKQDEMSEFVFLGLRKIKGISQSLFLKRFGISIEELYGDSIQKHLANGLLLKNGDRYFLSTKGLDLANLVMEDFV